MGPQSNRPEEISLHQQGDSHSDSVWWQAHFVIYFFQDKATLFSWESFVSEQMREQTSEMQWRGMLDVGRGSEEEHCIEKYRKLHPTLCYILVKFVGRLLSFLGKNYPENKIVFYPSKETVLILLCLSGALRNILWAWASETSKFNPCDTLPPTRPHLLQQGQPFFQIAIPYGPMEAIFIQTSKFHSPVPIGF